jgi:hypothetical protein
MSLPRRSPRIAHLTYASEQRQLAAKKTLKATPVTPVTPATPATPVGTPAITPVSQTPYITTMNITSYWRDKLYDEVAVEDWYFTVLMTLSDGSKRTSAFWFNRIYMNAESIHFGYGDYIAMHEGSMCLVRPSPFRATEYVAFTPHINMVHVRGAFLPILRKVGDTYEFPFDVPAGTYPWDYQTPTFVISL